MQLFNNRTAKGLAFTIAIGGTLPLCRAAHAENWTFQVKGTGTTTTSNPVQPNPATSNWNPDDNESWVDSRGLFFPDISYIGQAVKAKTNGSFTLEAIFTPSAGEALPASVNVLVTATAWASAQKREAGTSTFTLSATALGVNASDKPAEFGIRKEANVGRLLKLSTQGATRLPNGSYKITKSIGAASAEAQGTVGTSPGVPSDPDEPNSPDTSDYDVGVGVGASADAKLDNRAVSISRGLAAKMKGALGVNIDESKDEWVDVDGTGHGHTTFSYHLVGTGVEQFNLQGFIANLPGTWTWKSAPDGTGDIPDVTWKWSPAGLSVDNPQGETYTSSTQRVPFGSLNKLHDDWEGTPSPAGQTYQVSYTATDKGDGASGTGQYILTLHDEYDHPRAGTLPRRVYNTEYPVKVNDGVKWYHDTVSRKLTGKVVHSWKASFTGGLKLKLASILFPEANLGATGEISGSKEFSVEEALSTTVGAGKHRYFYVNIHEELEHHLVDHWGKSGFIGTEDQWLPHSRAAAYEPGFSQEYRANDFDSRDHHGLNDSIDQYGDYAETESLTP